MEQNGIKILSSSISSKINFFYKQGFLCSNQGDYTNAAEYFNKALELDPTYPGSYLNLGNAYKNSGKLLEAFNCYKNAAKLNHDYAEAYQNMGNILKEKNKYRWASAFYEKALELKPDFYELYNNLGIVYFKFDVNKAFQYFMKALELSPDSDSILNNIGMIYQSYNDIENAHLYFNRALKINPDHGAALLNNGEIYLLEENFEEGWKYINQGLSAIKVYDLPDKKIFNNSLQNKTVYVYYEDKYGAGFGDSLQFTRFLPLLREKGAKILLKTHKDLKSLFLNNVEAELINNSDQDFDYKISFFGLPYVFNVGSENLYTGKYIHADYDKVLSYKENYFSHNKLKIGLFWQCNPAYQNKRAIPLKNLYPLAQLDGIELYSLQKGYGVEQLEDLPSNIKITNLGKTFNDFSDTAAAIENLDLIISVDSAISHLAGAMGKKTFVLLPYFNEWRWGFNKKTSVWYDSVTLYKQEKFDSWDKPVQNMMDAIKNSV